PGRAHVLQVRYTVPTFKRPEKVRFQYRLRGQEEKWVTPDPEGDRLAYYTNLRPGRYSFELKADNTEGAWGKPVTFNFAVAPHFWQTWLFYAACTAMVVGAGLSIHYIRLKVQRRILVLEQKHALAEERARIARDMHDQLGASLTKIQLLSVLASRDKERTASVDKRLESIAQTSRDAAEDMDEIVWAVNPRNDHLENLADYLGRYSEEFLRAAGLRCKLNIPATLPAVVVNTEVRHAVFLAVKECLNNVAKHARAREVLFEMSARDGALEIIIADDGIGFDPSRNSGKGDGLENLQNRLKRFSGWIRWESSANAGTAVRIGLPIDRKPGI
ncbi:MAG TPA: sensor histidine kinase, partial [Candidatus Kapabacteria bacterium]|nr:sensor histidine kinase [Candidatus Kapabacteria bacterium]